MSERLLTRTALAGGIVFAVLSFLQPDTAPAVEADLTYAVLRNGDRIGSQSIKVTRDGAERTVQIKTDVVVRMAMIPVYRFEQDSREVWRAGRLTSLTSETNDDGDRHDLWVSTIGDHLDVVGDGKRTKMEAGILPASLWNHALVDQTRLLNTIDGKTMAVTVADLGVDTLQSRGRMLQAHHYRLSGGLERDLWYDLADTLVQVGFKGSDDSAILYVLR